MNKKISEFDSLSDFGYKSIVNQNGKVDFITCDCSFDKLADGKPNNVVYTNGDLSTGKYFSLTEILSGGSELVSSSDIPSKDSAELALDYTIPSSLAYLGSLYSTVQIAINNIRENYPNGFMIVDSITGVNALMFNASDTYMYGGTPFKLLDYGSYEIIQLYNSAYNSTFQIIEQITGTTFALFLELDGQPSDGTGYEHILQPKQSTIDKFYSTISQYEKDLLVPPYNRVNFWPRDLVASNNILMDGTRYDDFVEEELSWAANADDEESNFIWRKLYPDGQKILDSEDGLMQKLVLAMAMNFDNIKRYQDQLKYQHTIGYETSNHISNNLIELMANQFNWSLGHNLNQDDYSKHIYSMYENYVTGQSQQKISASDVNFEVWRRILANLVTLYKKKGTKEAIKYVANIYGLPEELLWIDELVEIYTSGNKKELIESESNIIIPMSGQSWYVDDSGSAKTLSYSVAKNTKYLNVNISPFDAIDFDYYDWGSAGHPNITNINGSSTTLSSNTATQREFFSNVYRATIKSDGSSRYESSYPLLENEGVLYYNLSTNRMKLSTLDPYMDFLDDNWNILISNLIPASSKLVSMGTLYKNPMWRREKYQWNDSELEAKQLPFNDGCVFDVFNPVFRVNQSKDSVIQIAEPIVDVGTRKTATLGSPQLSSAKSAKISTNIASATISSNKQKNMSCSITLQEPTGEYYEPASDSQAFDYIYSSTTYQIGSPMLEPVSGQYGTLDYTNYTEDALVVTNQNSFPITFSAYNLSDSGYTKLELDLFRKYSDDSVVVDETTTYSILSVDHEEQSHGIYRVSSLENIDTFDYISVESDTIKNVQITYMDTGTSQIRTSPKIGLLGLDTNATFKRIVNFFNWAAPIQSVVYTNYPTGYTGDFSLPTINTNSRTSANTYSTTGTVYVGGLDYLNSEILIDKTEYFYRTRAITHAPKEWGTIAGMIKFPILASGGTLLDSGYDLSYINDIKYYGRYFMFMKTPKVPISSLVGATNVASTTGTPEYSQTLDASVSARWNGVSDSNRMELQYLKSPSITAYTSYTQISSSSWESSSAVTINVPARNSIGDDYIYTIQTTLEPDTYYWWRVKNFRSKINMFGHNLEYFTGTEPKMLHTGGFAGGGRREGEVPVEPTIPTPVIGGSKKQQIEG